MAWRGLVADLGDEEEAEVRQASVRKLSFLGTFLGAPQGVQEVHATRDNLILLIDGRQPMVQANAEGQVRVQWGAVLKTPAVHSISPRQRSLPLRQCWRRH